MLQTLVEEYFDNELKTQDIGFGLMIVPTNIPELKKKLKQLADEENEYEVTYENRKRITIEA